MASPYAGGRAARYAAQFRTEKPPLTPAEKAAKDAGFSSVADQMQNRILRNQLEEKATRLGIPLSEAYALAGGDLTNTQALQNAWNQLTGPSAAQKAPAQQAEQPLYGKQYSYTDPGDKGYFGMADYRELQNQGASRADMIRYAFSAPKGVGNKVAEQLGIRAFDAPIPSSLSYTDPGDKGFFGMKDFEELSRQGATLQQIKDYASKAKYGVGGEAASILGIRPAGEADFTRAKADSTADAASKRETALINEINTLTTGFETQLQNIATQNQAIRDEQTKRITDLQNVMQAQAQLRDRPTVAGIKTAAGSAGDAMQVARRGVSGTFGRRGMRIQSLNV